MLSLHDSQKILGLYNLIIKNTLITDDTCTFEVEMIRKPHFCPSCGCMTNRIR